MSPMLKIAVVLVAAMITLEGLLILLWPERIRHWLEQSSPGQLRWLAATEFALGITLFFFLIRHF